MYLLLACMLRSKEQINTIFPIHVMLAVKEIKCHKLLEMKDEIKT